MRIKLSEHDVDAAVGVIRRLLKLLQEDTPIQISVDSDVVYFTTLSNPIVQFCCVCEVESAGSTVAIVKLGSLSDFDFSFFEISGGRVVSGNKVGDTITGIALPVIAVKREDGIAVKRNSLNSLYRISKSSGVSPWLSWEEFDRIYFGLSDTGVDRLTFRTPTLVATEKLGPSSRVRYCHAPITFVRALFNDDVYVHHDQHTTTVWDESGLILRYRGNGRPRGGWVLGSGRSAFPVKQVNKALKLFKGYDECEMRILPGSLSLSINEHEPVEFESQGNAEVDVLMSTKQLKDAITYVGDECEIYSVNNGNGIVLESADRVVAISVLKKGKYEEKIKDLVGV